MGHGSGSQRECGGAWDGLIWAYSRVPTPQASRDKDSEKPTDFSATGCTSSVLTTGSTQQRYILEISTHSYPDDINSTPPEVY